MRKEQKGVSIVSILLTVFSLLVLSGCASNDVATPEIADPLPPAARTVASFQDIELPSEMEYNSDESLSIRNDNFSGGVFYYKGKVDVDSLKEFIAISMRNHKWKLDGENVMKKDSVLAFTKPNKTCLYIIKDDLHNTKLTLVVTANLAASNKMNPFGEPVN